MEKYLYKQQTQTTAAHDYVCDKCGEIILKGNIVIKEIRRKKKHFTTKGVFHPECHEYKAKLGEYNGQYEHWIKPFVRGCCRD